MKRKAVLNVVVACLALTLGTVSASADQITLASAPQTISLLATSTSSMELGLGCPSAGFTGTCMLSGQASFTGDATIGMYSFTTNVPAASNILTAFSSGPSATVFPISMNGSTASFSYTGGDGDTLTGSVAWTLINNGSTNPHLDGVLTVATVNDLSPLDRPFAYVAGQPYGFDILLSTLSCNDGTSGSGCTLEHLYMNAAVNGGGKDTVSSGQIPVPEPATLTLLGTGLLGMAGWARRRKMKK